jgi:hypothetical protein
MPSDITLFRPLGNSHKLFGILFPQFFSSTL